MKAVGNFVEIDGLKTRLMVGLEIHVELCTRTKMFTSAPNVAHPENYDAAANTLCDPVVIGMPGVLPVINKRAVEMSMLVGLALGCKIDGFTKWDRKSYYYPDLPKNYQISQYDLPLCGAGSLEIPLTDEVDGPVKVIGITRAHLEEDAGKLMHEGPGGVSIDHSIVDLNRAGTPLLEIVTDPDFDTADQVVTFGQMLRQICRHLGVTEGVMQKGHMRFEPNINVIIEKDGVEYRTPVIEIKNLNSFKAVHGAIEYEHRRQVQAWRDTGKVMGAGAKSTHGWDDNRGVTFLQREKEDAHDYRYFPDPDLVPITVSGEWIAEIGEGMVELPFAKWKRYVKELGLSAVDARGIIEEPAVARFFEEVLALGVDCRRAGAMLLNSGAKRANEKGCLVSELGISAQQVKDIADLVAGDKVSSSGGDELFGYCCESEDAAGEVAKAKGLLQVSDTGALEGYVDEVLGDAKNAKIVGDIAEGKDKAIGALLGQIMKLSKGQANPKLVGEMIKKKVRS